MGYSYEIPIAYLDILTGWIRRQERKGRTPNSNPVKAALL